MKKKGDKVTFLHLMSLHSKGRMVSKYKREVFQMPAGLVASCIPTPSVWTRPERPVPKCSLE